MHSVGVQPLDSEVLLAQLIALPLALVRSRAVAVVIVSLAELVMPVYVIRPRLPPGSGYLQYHHQQVGYTSGPSAGPLSPNPHSGIARK